MLIKIKKILKNRYLHIFGLLAIFSCVLAINFTQSTASDFSSTKGYANATVVKNRIVVSDNNKSSVKEIEKKDSIVEQKQEGANKMAVSYVMYFEPNTVVDASFKIGNSESEKTENGEENTVVELKNSDGEVMKIKLKKGDGKMTFDQNGKGNLNINPEIDFSSGKELQGSYKATFDVIISY